MAVASSRSPKRGSLLINRLSWLRRALAKLVEGRRFDEFLFLAGQSREAVREGVGNAEVHEARP